MSVISRMLQDLESRGASVPLNRARTSTEQPTETQTAKPSGATTNRAWLRTALLSSGLLAGVAGFYGFNMDAGLYESSVAQVTDRAVPKSLQPKSNHAMANATPTWRLDWALSLGRVKPKATQVSLSPNLDVSNDAVDVTEHTQGEPPHAQVQPVAAAANMTTNFAIIDPPAAGRVQSTANQAVEAYRRAMDTAEQGRDGVALDAALQAIKLDAQHMPARRLAIALALDQKQMDQAGALLDEGLQLAPRDGELLYLQARRLAMAGANEQALTVLQGVDRPTVEALGLKAGLLARTGRYAPATAAYEQALKTRPDNATWWLGLGVALNAQGQGAMAKEAFLRARKLGQLAPDVQAWLDQQL